MALISLATAKARLPYLVASSGPSAPGLSDADIQRYINDASGAAESVARRDLAASDYTEIVSGNGRYEIMLGHYPVESITSVKIASDGGFDSADAVTDYELDADSGILYRRTSVWPKGNRNIQIVYRAGYGLEAGEGEEDPTYLVPDKLQRAVCEVIDWMYQRDRNQTIGIRTTIGADGLQTSYSLDVPLSARSVFESYREMRV